MRREIVCHSARSCVTLNTSPLRAVGFTSKGLMGFLSRWILGRSRGVPRAGRWLSIEGVAWLAIIVLLLTVGITKSINLLSLLASMLGAVLFISAVTVGRRLRRLEVRRTIDEQVIAGMVSVVCISVTSPGSRRLRGVNVEDPRRLGERQETRSRGWGIADVHEIPPVPIRT